MYACIPEIGRGFFQGVCAPNNATAYFRDPPPPPHTRIDSWRYALALLRQSGLLLVANTAFREDFFSPTLGNERLPSGLRPHPGDTRRNKPTYVQSVIHNGRVHASSRKGGSVMFARVSQYSVDSERLQQEQGEVEEHLLPALRMQPGFSGGLLLANPQKGKVLAVTLWESEQDMHATDEASHWFSSLRCRSRRRHGHGRRDLRGLPRTIVTSRTVIAVRPGTNQFGGA